jgi:hypothetical protein
LTGQYEEADGLTGQYGEWQDNMTDGLTGQYKETDRLMERYEDTDR